MELGWLWVFGPARPGPPNFRPGPARSSPFFWMNFEAQPGPRAARAVQGLVPTRVGNTTQYNTGSVTQTNHRPSYSNSNNNTNAILLSVLGPILFLLDMTDLLRMTDTIHRLQPNIYADDTHIDGFCQSGSNQSTDQLPSSASVCITVQYVIQQYKPKNARYKSW